MTADAAAALLGTSTAILAQWEERFGYPVPMRSGDGQRLYPEEMVIALRDALSRELSIAAAITQARRRRRPGEPDGGRGRFGGRHHNPEEAR